MYVCACAHAQGILKQNQLFWLLEAKTHAKVQ